MSHGRAPAHLLPLPSGWPWAGRRRASYASPTSIPTSRPMVTIGFSCSIELGYQATKPSGRAEKLSATIASACLTSPKGPDPLRVGRLSRRASLPCSLCLRAIRASRAGVPFTPAFLHIRERYVLTVPMESPRRELVSLTVSPATMPVSTSPSREERPSSCAMVWRSCLGQACVLTRSVAPSSVALALPSRTKDTQETMAKTRAVGTSRGCFSSRG